MKVNKCVLCKEHFTGIGNNPVPLKTSGVCCDSCNTTKVIPARINFYGIKISKKQLHISKSELDYLTENGNVILKESKKELWVV